MTTTLKTLLILLLTTAALPAAARADKPTAVTAIFSYYDALRSIGGDDLKTTILLPPAASPHEYEPTVRDKATVAKAQLVVVNGLNIDRWLVKMGQDNSAASVINVGDLLHSRGIQPLHTEEVSVTPPEAKPSDPAEDDSAGNPHIWLDPRVQAMAAEAIRAALIKIDPVHAAAYNTRAAAYLDQLTKLDKDFSDATAKFARKDFIGFHSAYAYLARRYGLNQVASVEEMPGEGPTISQTARIIHLIKNKNIKTVFTESAFPAKTMDMIVRETGVTTGILQPIETYDNIQQTYVGLMRENLEALKKALN